MSYQDILNEDQRLVILRSLEEMPGYSANDSILHSVLLKYGHSISRDQLRSHLFWLQEQSLVGLEQLGSTYIATVTARGVDVAAGRSKTPGVKPPGPRG